MKFAKLIGDRGGQIANPEAVECSISWSGDGKAYAWDAIGGKLLAEMRAARVVWIECSGIMLDGMEPIDGKHGCYRAQSWQISF